MRLPFGLMPICDTQAPDVPMANPKSGNDAKGLMTVDAGASGNVGVTRMGWDVMVDGKLDADGRHERADS